MESHLKKLKWEKATDLSAAESSPEDSSQGILTGLAGVGVDTDHPQVLAVPSSWITSWSCRPSGLHCQGWPSGLHCPPKPVTGLRPRADHRHKPATSGNLPSSDHRTKPRHRPLFLPFQFPPFRPETIPWKRGRHPWPPGRYGRRRHNTAKLEEACEVGPPRPRPSTGLGGGSYNIHIQEEDNEERTDGWERKRKQELPCSQSSTMECSRHCKRALIR